MSGKTLARKSKVADDKKDFWNTSWEAVRDAEALIGMPFVLDAAASDAGTSKAKTFITPQQDALQTEWLAGHGAVWCNPPFTRKPYSPGYFVVYQDGYQSFSPAEAFEKGYMPLAPYSGAKDSTQPVPPTPAAPSRAELDVLAERRRQVEAEGYDHQHDDTYQNGELAKAAGCYLLYGDAYPNPGEPPELWPWPAEYWKPKDWRRDLIRAGALLIADLERLDRAAAKEQL